MINNTIKLLAFSFFLFNTASAFAQAQVATSGDLATKFAPEACGAWMQPQDKSRRQLMGLRECRVIG